MSKQSNYIEKISMKFNISQLNRTIIALLNNGTNRKFASNVSRLFGLFDVQKTDIEKEVRSYLIRTICSIICEKNIIDKDAILSFIDLDGKYKDDAEVILNDLFNKEISENEMSELDKTISNQLRYASVENASDDLMDMMQNLKTGNYDSFEEEIENINVGVEGLAKNLRNSRVSLEDSKSDIGLSNSSFINILDRQIKKEKNPSSKVKTGLQTLNSILNGGYEKGREYVALGTAKSGKSRFLLWNAIWAKKYNEFQLKDPTKTPVVVYLSLENSNEETITRIWNYCFGNNDELKNHTAIEAAKKLQQCNIFTPDSPGSPELLLWYRKNKSISTVDVNQMLEDLEKEGKECVFLVVDYLKRLRSAVPNKELRFELSQITDELSTISKDRDIPILTAMQLNRDAFRTIEDARNFDEKLAATNRLGASNIGESIDIIQNCDMGFIVNSVSHTEEEDGQLVFNDRFFTFKVIACRMKPPKISSFTHRFAEDNDMALPEDIYCKHTMSIIGTDEMTKERAKNPPRSSYNGSGGGRTIRS